MIRPFIILIILICGFHLSKSQTFSFIDQLSEYTGKTFDELEKGLTIKSDGKKTGLGIEHRSYDFKTYFALISEVDDEKKIGEISIYSVGSKNYQELWYSIVSEMNKNEKYQFVKSFIADPEDKFTSNKLSYQELIALLRKTYKSKEWVYEVIFNKDSNYYKVSCSDVSVDVQIQNRPFEKKSYENL